MRLKHVKQLGVVDLKQHAGDLAGQGWGQAADEGEESLAQHLLLFLGRGGGQQGGRQGLLVTAAGHHHTALLLADRVHSQPLHGVTVNHHTGLTVSHHAALLLADRVEGTQSTTTRGYTVNHHTG